MMDDYQARNLLKQSAPDLQARMSITWAGSPTRSTSILLT